MEMKTHREFVVRIDLAAIRWKHDHYHVNIYVLDKYRCIAPFIHSIFLMKFALILFSYLLKKLGIEVI